MARQLFGRRNASPAQPFARTDTSRKTSKILGDPRSPGYLAALRGLDGGTAIASVDVVRVRSRIGQDAQLSTGPSPGEVADIRERLAREFVAKGARVPTGLIAHCFLGWRFEVHTLSWSHDVIVHYKRGEALPDGLEHARRWAQSTTYAAIEAYDDHVVCIHEDGTIVTVEV